MAKAMARLPREMVDEVLCRLTVRDLLRYRSVCKEWRSRIDGLDFIKMHLKRSSQKMGIFINAFVEGLYWVDLETLDSAVQISHLPFSPEEGQRRRPRTTSILSRGGCSGLLLVEGLGKLAIWNPSTRWHMHVLASGNSAYNSSTSVIGFGCGTLNDGDPKLLISTAISRHPRDEILNYGRRFELFSAKTKTWKTLGTGFPDYFGFEYGYALVHNCDDHNHNALNWIVAPRLGGVAARHEPFILAFDLVTEEQRKFSMPNFQGERCSRYKVVEFGGCLCVVCSVVSDSRFDIWAMKEYGESSTWAKLFSVVPPPSNGSATSYFELIPLTYYKTSDEVLLFVDRKRFNLYDLKTKTSKDVSISGLPAAPFRCFSAELCVSSLVRVDDAMIS
ncbi:F-box domain containing protein [Trema orientale]|uniref:F-box domain containing protein n=1 Tax=Trema orientale TaxID=63057 RepID=A0A2P5FSN7_TREOI|nr:F-box domain containing protein [Trema orientale]